MKCGCEAVQTCLYYVHTSINIHERVCTMYIQIYEIMNMHEQLEPNEIMYMYVHTTYNVCIFMFMYIHVHTRS
jgi:hypothetical protein